MEEILKDNIVDFWLDDLDNEYLDYLIDYLNNLRPNCPDLADWAHEEFSDALGG